MNFMPFDIKCFEKLNQKFQFLFEPRLIDEICQFGKIRKYEADEMLLDIGDPIEHMPFVMSGSIKILTEDKEGNELLLYYLGIGDTCAVTLNCCAKEAKSTIRVMTESATELLFVPVIKMEDWMVKFQSWRRYVLDSYNTRLNEMVEAIDNVVFNNMEERLTNYLNNKVELTKSNILNISHLDIANDLYSSRVVISRLMKKLEKTGFLVQSRNRVEIL